MGKTMRWTITCPPEYVEVLQGDDPALAGEALRELVLFRSGAWYVGAYEVSASDKVAVGVVLLIPTPEAEDLERGLVLPDITLFALAQRRGFLFVKAAPPVIEPPIAVQGVTVAEMEAAAERHDRLRLEVLAKSRPQPRRAVAAYN